MDKRLGDFYKLKEGNIYSMKRLYLILEQTSLYWNKCISMGIAEVRNLKVFEEENWQPKQMVADLSLDHR